MHSATATIKRCSWVSVDDPLMLQYHDREWGVPVHDDRKHFEFLVLEAARAQGPNLSLSSAALTLLLRSACLGLVVSQIIRQPMAVGLSVSPPTEC